MGDGNGQQLSAGRGRWVSEFEASLLNDLKDSRTVYRDPILKTKNKTNKTVHI